jgi:hypothetical protein
MPELGKVLEQTFLNLGAVKAEVNPTGLATHWRTMREAQVAREKITQIVFECYHCGPERVEVWQETNGTWAMFCVWPLSAGAS